MSEENLRRLSIRWSEEARADHRQIDRMIALDILHCTDRYLTTRSGDVKKLKPPQTGFRLRCGDYRLFFEEKAKYLSKLLASATAAKHTVKIWPTLLQRIYAASVEIFSRSGISILSLPPQSPSRKSPLRQQLAILKQRHPQPHFTASDLLFWVVLRRFWSRWKQALILVQPETVVRWHRAGFKAYWAWLSRVCSSIRFSKRTLRPSWVRVLTKS